MFSDTMGSADVKEFDWGPIYFADRGKPYGCHDPRCIQTSEGPVLIFQSSKVVWNSWEEHRPETRPIVCGYPLRDDGLSQLGEYLPSTETLEVEKIKVRLVEREDRREVRQELKRLGIRGRAYFWKR
jgi:hypothetical protein